MKDAGIAIAAVIGAAVLAAGYMVGKRESSYSGPVAKETTWWN